MKIKISPIKTKKDYENALSMIDKLWDAKLKTKEGDALDIVTTLVEVYEEKNHSIYPPDPVKAILFRLEQMGLQKSDIAKFLGGSNRVSEIIHKKRRLNLNMIRNLHEGLNIPYESLITEH